MGIYTGVVVIIGALFTDITSQRGARLMAIHNLIHTGEFVVASATCDHKQEHRFFGYQQHVDPDHGVEMDKIVESAAKFFQLTGLQAEVFHSKSHP